MKVRLKWCNYFIIRIILCKIVGGSFKLIAIFVILDCSRYMKLVNLIVTRGTDGDSASHLKSLALIKHWDNMLESIDDIT